MIQAHYKKYILDFKNPSGTSRGVLTQKETWFLILKKNNQVGIGECSLLKGLSIDDVPDYEQKLQWVCYHIHLGKEELWNQLMAFPSIQFGVEMAFLSLESKTPFELFPSEFTSHQVGIPINGLVWMGSPAFMQEQIQDKINQGFTCVKMKIGAIHFKEELALLQSIRKQFSSKEIELRVDANGAFAFADVMDKLNQLAELQIHSIEQPIAVRQYTEMAYLCKKTPIPIALDEELIGIFDEQDKLRLLEHIQPKFIILKPSLIGGFKGTQQWIDLANQLNIGWWITSALESNVGLNAITQWTYLLKNPMPQGLGTGSLYTNNIESPLKVEKGMIQYVKDQSWQADFLFQ